MNKNEALNNIGKHVYVTTDLWGEYIGRLLEVISQPKKPWRGRVEILAVMKYPVKGLGERGYLSRKPYQFGEIKEFGGVNIKIYDGTIPDYRSSLNSALSAAIAEITNQIKRAESANYKDSLIYRWLEELQKDYEEFR
jgi:hypothetical protein